jgi:GT2 family glycosyltransferase
LLLRVLGALAAQELRPREVIVVDNASTDESGDAAEEAGARVLRMPINVGFARAVNAGIRASTGSQVAILNNDIDLAADWLRRLAAALAGQDVWFATGKILSAAEPGKIDGAYDLIARSGRAWRAGHGRKDGLLWSQPRTIQMTSMTAALFRREVFDRVGFLDEDYGSYYEDVDFGLRCALAGLKGRYVPDAQCWHEGSATLGAWSGPMVERLTRNQRFLRRKHFPGGLSRAVLVGDVLWALLCWRRGSVGAWWRGFAEGGSAEISIPGPKAGLAKVLEASERELLSLQRQSGGDTYWRWYERLT